MSTRSMTIFNGRGATINLYRHCDGYPAGAGDSLLEAIGTTEKHRLQLGAIATALVDLRYPCPSYDPSGKTRPVYELADWAPEGQSDLEHVYVVWANGDKYSDLRITHYGRANWQQDTPKDWPSQTYDVESFRAFVAREQAEIDRRVATRKGA